MLQIPLCSSSTLLSPNSFWNSLLIYHDRPHLVNRKLLGASQALFVRLLSIEPSKLYEVITKPAVLYETRRLKELTSNVISKDFLLNILKPHFKNVKLQETTREEFDSCKDGIYVSIRILLPRLKSLEKCIETVVLDKDQNVATFLATVESDAVAPAPAFQYSIAREASGALQIRVGSFGDADTGSAEWLSLRLFEKLLKWADDEAVKNIQPSLSLVSVERHMDFYSRLKEKYGAQIVKVWPEKTDPLKFVYEDLAIAAYLMALWEERCEGKKPSFVDLGCGNGLLVHILSEEGYSGYGIDVRKRKIWDCYPPSTKLLIKTIIPTHSSLFPDADWIIGNHSDELTPWIPVITAQSSKHTNFFLLPCCTYDFNGTKYQRKNTSLSTYAEYMNYIRKVCEDCGFVTKCDKLRIPSTKRACIVSNGRIQSEGVAVFLSEKCSLVEFRARSEVEKVQNCTQLNRSLVESIVKLVYQRLILETCYESAKKKWNLGGSVGIKDLVKCLPQTMLKELKKECGGLQTLLRNHRYIFELEGGVVKLRRPVTSEATGGRYKDKPCWFFINHVDGCVNSAEDCAYKH